MRVTARDLATPRRRKPLPRRERDVQAAILEALKLMPGVYAQRMNTGAVKEGARFIRFGKKGNPDIWGWVQWSWEHACRDPRGYVRPLLIECKRAGEKLTAHQQAFRAMAESDGVLYIVAYSLDDVLAALR